MNVNDDVARHMDTQTDPTVRGGHCLSSHLCVSCVLCLTMTTLYHLHLDVSTYLYNYSMAKLVISSRINCAMSRRSVLLSSQTV